MRKNICKNNEFFFLALCLHYQVQNIFIFYNIRLGIRRLKLDYQRLIFINSNEELLTLNISWCNSTKNIQPMFNY